MEIEVVLTKRDFRKVFVTVVLANVVSYLMITAVRENMVKAIERTDNEE